MSITELHGDAAGVDVAVEVGRRLGDVRDELASIVSALDVSELVGSEAAHLAMLFAEVERLSMAGKTVAAGRVAETGHHRFAGFGSAQKWLADRTKSTVWEAAKTIETARHVADEALAPTRSALVGGALTATQAHEIATAAAKSPSCQSRLLDCAARETAARLKDECRAVRLAAKGPEDPDERAKRIKDEMAFGCRDLGGGISEMFARMPTSWWARVKAAIEQRCDEVFADARAEGRNDSHSVYMVEALVTLILFGSAHGGPEAGEDGASESDEPAVGDDLAGDETPAPTADADGADEDSDVGGPGVGGFDDDFDASDPVQDKAYEVLLAAIRGPAPPGPPRRVRRARAKARRGRRCGGRVAPRAKIIVRVDWAALKRGYAGDGELCDIAGVGPVPVATVRELWPDAVVKAVTTRGVDVLNVTSLGRRATEAMETAMQFTMPRCTNIACDNDRFVQIDHRLGYANVRRTRLDELDPLCSCCHKLKTNENWQLVAGTGRRRFVPPDIPITPVVRRHLGGAPDRDCYATSDASELRLMHREGRYMADAVCPASSSTTAVRTAT